MRQNRTATVSLDRGIPIVFVAQSQAAANRSGNFPAKHSAFRFQFDIVMRFEFQRSFPGASIIPGRFDFHLSE